MLLTFTSCVAFSVLLNSSWSALVRRRADRTRSLQREEDNQLLD
jgi:hypothetical protein